jgi:hypothetical protein
MNTKIIFAHGITAGLLIMAAIPFLSSSQRSSASEPSRSRIEGTVNDFSGRLQRIRVTAFLLQTPDGYPVFTMACQTFTDSEGNYTCAEVPPGHYILLAYPSHSVNSPDLAQDDAPSPTFYPGTANIEDAELVRARPNMLNVFNFSMLQGPLFQISGRIDNKPGSAALALYRIDSARAFKLISDQIIKYDSTTGTFAVDGLPDGQYLLGGDLYFGSTIYGNSTPEAPKRGSAAITVAGGNVSNAVLEPKALTTIDGQVEIDGAIPGRSLNLELQDIEDAHQKYEIAVSPDGAFQFSNLPCGHYRISGVNLASAYVGSVKVGDLAQTLGQFIIPSDSRVHVEVNMSLHSDTISGAVSGGIPGNFHAYIVAKNELTGSVDIRETDQNGRFEIPGLAPGQYDLYAWKNLDGIAYETKDGLKKYERNKVAVAIGKGVQVETVVVPLIISTTD